MAFGAKTNFPSFGSSQPAFGPAKRASGVVEYGVAEFGTDKRSTGGNKP